MVDSLKKKGSAFKRGKEGKTKTDSQIVRGKTRKRKKRRLFLPGSNYNGGEIAIFTKNQKGKGKRHEAADQSSVKAKQRKKARR